MTSFGHLLTDEVAVGAFTGRASDAFGTAQYAAQVRMRAAVSEGFVKVRDSDGNERVSSTQIVTETSIGLEDRIWIVARAGDESLGDDLADDDKARTPIAVRSDRSRKSGTFLFQTFL